MSHNDTYVHKLQKVSEGSLSVVLPAHIVDELNLREHQKVEIHRYGDKIIIQDWSDT